MIAIYIIIRCLPLWFPSLGGFTILCHLGAFINGIGGPILMSAPIQISATWFPPQERTRATSISQMFNAVGVGVSFFLGTLIFKLEIGIFKIKYFGVISVTLTLTQPETT